MATDIDIANGALALLKASRLTSMHDNSETGTLVRLRFALCRDTLLELAPWHFASVRARLARSGILPSHAWSYQYPLPTQPWCIKVRDPDPTYTPWEIGYHSTDGRILLSDNESMLIRYTARIEDLSIWSPLAAMSLSYMLAGELAMALTGDMNKAKGWQQAYLQTVGEAISSEAREGSPIIARAPTTFDGIR